MASGYGGLSNQDIKIEEIEIEQPQIEDAFPKHDSDSASGWDDFLTDEIKIEKTQIMSPTPADNTGNLLTWETNSEDTKTSQTYEDSADDSEACNKEGRLDKRMKIVDNIFVTNRISSGAYSLAPRRKGKSFVWNVLAEILKEDGSLVKDLVYCRSCRKVLKCVGNQTSNLSRHKCCQRLKQPNTLTAVPTKEKKEALDVVSKWIVGECRPFSCVSGSGFQDMVQFFIKMGATYGDLVDVEDMLPSATTIAVNCQKEAKEKKALISKELKEIVSRNGLSVTVDVWTDNYVNRNFIAVTLHFQKQYQLVDIILGLKSMDFQRSTAVNVLQKLKSILNQFDIQNIESIKFVTERGETIVEALENNTRLNCSSQLFANVLNKSFEETLELNDVITACKKIVKYFKKANLQHRLNTSFKKHFPTLWKSIYCMFRSILDNWLEVNNILNETKESQRLLNIDINMLETIVELCKNFEIIFKQLQTCSSASICFVQPSINKVKSLCESNMADMPAISILKENIKRNVDEIWETNLSMWHKAAVFLYPPALTMQFVDLEEIKDFCISEIRKMDKNPEASTLSEQQSPKSDLCPTSSNSENSSTLDIDSPALKNKFFFSNLIQKSANVKDSPYEEVERYCKEKVIITDFEVMMWWKNNEKVYPQLSKFAFQVLSIPACSAAAERVRSLAANIITEKRNRLEPNALSNLLFLNSLNNK